MTVANAQCPWCQETFPRLEDAKHHVKFCAKAPRPRGKMRQPKCASGAEEVFLSADAASGRQLKKAAHYEIVEDRKTRLVLRDLGPFDKHPTITNDAENVVKKLLPRLKGRRLYYYDSLGQLDELRIEKGKFVGFAIRLFSQAVHG